MEAVSYRVHRIGDTDLALMRELNGVFAEAFEDAASYSSPPEDDYLRAVLRREETVVLVAQIDGRVVGGIVAYELPKLEARRSELYLYDLAVATPHRRKGIARALLAELCALATARGISAVFVQAVPSDGPAVALYESLATREVVLHFELTESN
ncbi:GNAT family N-acetyltransferase [Myxococcus sp. SDU36]|nr:GNAT family N-acetyltransferase [Myxococcus sp. SDU36]